MTGPETKDYDDAKSPMSNWVVKDDGLYFDENKKCCRLEEIIALEKTVKNKAGIGKLMSKYASAIRIGSEVAAGVVGIVFLDRLYPAQTTVGFMGAAIGMMAGFGIGASSSNKVCAKTTFVGIAIGFIAGFA